MVRTFAALVVALTLGNGWPSSVVAWGDVGHKIVCGIAFAELNDRARQEVMRLIAMDQEFHSFPNACTWPDHPRRRANEHFVNAPRDLPRFAGAQCPVAAVCLFTAIEKDLAVLRSATSGDQAKLDALKYLGHWLGDLHQPLHVSYEDDRGGGRIRDAGGCGFGLHHLWDSCIIARRLGSDPGPIATTLRDAITDAQRTSWQATSILEWANESFEIARRETVGYCVRSGTACFYAEGRERFTSGQPERIVTVDAAYLDTHGPVVAERLKRAGVRLGHLLNQVLGQ